MPKQLCLRNKAVLFLYRQQLLLFCFYRNFAKTGAFSAIQAISCIAAMQQGVLLACINNNWYYSAITTNDAISALTIIGTILQLQQMMLYLL